MKSPLPVNADEIFVEWVTTEGGISAVSFTDDKGDAYIGLYPLNRMGNPNGLPIWFRRNRLISKIMVGFREHKPLVISIDVEVCLRGISLIVIVPFDATRQYQRQTFAPWGGERPRYGFMVFPSNSNWPVNPFPCADHL